MIRQGKKLFTEGTAATGFEQVEPPKSYPAGVMLLPSDDREFAVVGSDGGLLPELVTARRLGLSPGERAEIVVRIRPGETVVLRSFEPDLGVNAFTRPFEGGKDRFDVLQLRAADDLMPSAALPDALGLAPDLGVTDDVEVDRTFTLQGNKINGQAMDMDRVDAVVEVNTTEVWEVENTDGDYHIFHVHDVQFQILTINGDPPPAEYGGWKDTVFLRPSTTVRLALRFSDYTDPDHPYMLHCHRLRHEDRGMMAQFVVVERESGDLLANNQ